MDARTGLWAGVGTAVVVAVAMTCGVALSSTRALADHAGTALADTAVVVHGTPGATAETDTDRAGKPETVSAPAPKDIGDARDEASTRETSQADSTSPRQESTGASDDADRSRTDSSKTSETAKTADRSDAPRPQSTGKATDSDRSRWTGGDAATDPARIGEQLRDRLREFTETWKKHAADRTDRPSRFIDDNTAVDRTDEDSGSWHHRHSLGHQKEQSPRSPDNGD